MVFDNLSGVLMMLSLSIPGLSLQQVYCGPTMCVSAINATLTGEDGDGSAESVIAAACEGDAPSFVPRQPIRNKQFVDTKGFINTPTPIVPGALDDALMQSYFEAHQSTVISSAQ